MEISRQIYSRLINLAIFLTLTSAFCRADCITESLGSDSPLSVCIETARGGFCGMSIMERQDDIVKGSIFNEFGITALDFEYNCKNGKLKLHDVISFLNKWYIKKIIKADMSTLLSNILLEKKTRLKGRELEITNDSVVLRNLKYNIVYSFSKISNNDTIE